MSSKAGLGSLISTQHQNTKPEFSKQTIQCLSHHGGTTKISARQILCCLGQAGAEFLLWAGIRINPKYQGGWGCCFNYPVLKLCSAPWGNIWEHPSVTISSCSWRGFVWNLVWNPNLCPGWVSGFFRERGSSCSFISLHRIVSQGQIPGISHCISRPVALIIPPIQFRRSISNPWEDFHACSSLGIFPKYKPLWIFWG